MGQEIEAWLSSPWVWALLIASFAIWLVAIVLVFRSKKFVNKILWTILTLVSGSFAWREGRLDIAISIPLGALFVIWFWRFGPAPSEEKLAAAQARASEARVDAAKKMVLTGVYLLAVAAALSIVWFTVSGEAFRLFQRFGGGAFPFNRGMMTSMALVSMAPIVLVFLFLSARPYWWGKILLIWAALSWIGFGVVTTGFIGHADTVTLLPLGAGLVMLAGFIVHQIVDPRWSGTYLRARAPA